MWQLRESLPELIDHTWRSCTSSTEGKFERSVSNSSMLISSGVPSIMIFMQSLKTGMEVQQMITENKYVQMGSAMAQSGLKFMMTAAVITPTDMSRSPRT